MASSYEIAEQINAQNQWFMQQNALSSQIGVNPMAFGGGMGGYNTGAPFMGNPVMSTAPGASNRMPGAFNYGNNMAVGYGFGNRAGAIAGGAMAMAPGAFGTALSIMAPANPFTNPIAGFGVGRALGLGVAGSAGVAGAFMLPAMAAQYAVGATVTGASQQSMIGASMGGFNFANPMSRTGTGFSRNDAMVVGDQVRQLAYIPELMTSVEELTKMIPKLRSSGLMQGVTSAREFASKFKEAIVTVREMSQLLGTTMESAADFFAHSRSVGMLGRGDTTRNAINAQVAMAATGMNMQQVQALQQSGANLATAAGGSRRAGTTAITNLATQIGFAQQSGALSQEVLQDMTGLVGSEAHGAAASRLLNAAVRMSGTPAARLLIAGAMKMDENGTPYIDQNIMKMVGNGTLSFSELQNMGRKNVAGRKNATAFTAHQSSLAMQFASAGGGVGVTGLLQSAMGSNADPNTIKLLLQQHAGMSEQEAEIQMKLYEQQMTGQGPQQQLLEQIRRAQASGAEGTPGAAFRRIGVAIGDKLKKPFLELGAKVHSTVGRWADEIAMDLVGNVVVSVAAETRDRYARDIAAGDKELLRSLISQETRPVFNGKNSVWQDIGDSLGLRDVGKRVGAVGEWQSFANTDVPTEKEVAMRTSMGQFIDKNYQSQDWSGYSREQIDAEIARRAYDNFKGGKGMGKSLEDWGNITAGIYEYAEKAGSQRGTADYPKGIATYVKDSRSYSRYGGGRDDLAGVVEMDTGKIIGRQRTIDDQIRTEFKTSGDRLIADSGLRKTVQTIANGASDQVKQDIIAALAQSKPDRAARIAKDANLNVDINASNAQAIKDALEEHKGKGSSSAKALDDSRVFDIQLLRRSIGKDAGEQAQILRASAEGAPSKYKALYESGAEAYAARSSIYLGGGTPEQLDKATEGINTWLHSVEKTLGGLKGQDKADLMGSFSSEVQLYIQAKEGSARVLKGLTGRLSPSEIATKLGDRSLASTIAKRYKGLSEIEMTPEVRVALSELRGQEAFEKGASSRAASTMPSPKDQAVINAMSTIAQAVINLNPDKASRERALTVFQQQGLDPQMPQHAQVRGTH
jgi:hypothetical protein